MELEEAASRIQALINFHNGLLKLQEVVNLARSVDNIKSLAAERQAAADRAKAELETVQQRLVDFNSRAQAQMAEANSQLSQLDAAHKQRIVALEDEFNARKSELDSALFSLQNKSIEATKAHDAALAGFAAQQLEVEKNIEKLNKIFDTLRAKAAAIGA